jgi:hypothetical protein
MKIKSIIMGSTGMVGKGVLLECLDNPSVESVLVINRTSCSIKHPKLKEIIHTDFFNFHSLQHELSGYNACYFCLGVSSLGKSEQEYRKITFELTLDFAKALLKSGPELTFCYVSGAGTDSSGTSRSMWAKVKGETENTILGLSFKGAYMFRPGFIQPMKGIKSKTRIYNVLYFFLKPLYFLLKPMESFVTNTETVGRAMINVTLNGHNKNILECKDINRLGMQKPNN